MSKHHLVLMLTVFSTLYLYIPKVVNEKWMLRTEIHDHCPQYWWPLLFSDLISQKAHNKKAKPKNPDLALPKRASNLTPISATAGIYNISRNKASSLSNPGLNIFKKRGVCNSYVRVNRFISQGFENCVAIEGKKMET